MSIESERQWHLDKRVPIALIVTLALQFGWGVWYMRGLEASVSSNIKDINRIENTIESSRDVRTDLSARVIRIEEKLSAQNELLRRIDRNMSSNAIRN